MQFFISVEVIVAVVRKKICEDEKKIVSLHRF